MGSSGAIGPAGAGSRDGSAGGEDPLTRARRWLERRLEDVPPELAEAVRRGLEGLEGSGDVPAGSTVAEALAAAALEQFDRILEAGEHGRDSALGLLAADATLTYAFEAAAEGGEGLGALAERLGPAGELGRRLARFGPGGGG